MLVELDVAGPAYLVFSQLDCTIYIQLPEVSMLVTGKGKTGETLSLLFVSTPIMLSTVRCTEVFVSKLALHDRAQYENIVSDHTASGRQQCALLEVD